MVVMQLVDEDRAGAVYPRQEDVMDVIFHGDAFRFRPCDTKGITPEALQELANKTGKMQYEPNNSWLVIKGVGYGWRV